MIKTLFLAALLALTLNAVAEPTQVIVVRHAERAAEPKDDPALSPDGVARAELLAETLQSAQVGTIFTTHYRRTQETAGPLARKLGLQPRVLTIRKGEQAAHIAELATEVRKANGVVLVVGHSNTVAGIVAALSSSRPLMLCETSFSHLFVVTPGEPSRPALQLRYGKPDVPPEPSCQ